MWHVNVVLNASHKLLIKWHLQKYPRLLFSLFSLFFIKPFQQGHSAAFYRDHPQDIRHRTIQSRKPPPMATHLMKGDPDSATSPSKYHKKQKPPPPLLPPPDVTLITPVTELNRIQNIDSLREADFRGLLISLDSEDEVTNVRKMPHTKEEALRLALSRRAIRQERNMAVHDDPGSKDSGDGEKGPQNKKRSTSPNKARPSYKLQEKVGKKVTSTTMTTTMTTSDSDEEFTRPTRRKPRKKRKDKSESENEISPLHQRKLGNNEGQENTGKDKQKVDSYVLTQWKLSQEKQLKRDHGTSTTNQAHAESEDHSIEISMQKMLHKSKSGFNLEDVRNALEMSRLMGESDVSIDKVGVEMTEIGGKNLVGKAKMEHKKQTAAKWQRLASRIVAQETMVGDPEVDRALMAGKLGHAIPEGDETEAASTDKYKRTNRGRLKQNVNESPGAKIESNQKQLAKSNNRERISNKVTREMVGTPSSTTSSTKLQKQNSKRQSFVPGNASGPDVRKRESVPASPLKARQNSPVKRDQHNEMPSNGTPQLPPIQTSNAMAPPRTEETAAESSKRLELINAARKAKQVSSRLGFNEESSNPSMNSNTQTMRQPKPKTGAKSKKAGEMLHLPLVTKKPKKKMPGEEDADQHFYRHFKLVFVEIPEPEDELPCE